MQDYATAVTKVIGYMFFIHPLFKINVTMHNC